MAARLKKKAELQKKASQAGTFQEKLKGELGKQAELKKKSKAERDEDMCALLGRGC